MFNAQSKEVMEELLQNEEILNKSLKYLIIVALKKATKRNWFKTATFNKLLSVIPFVYVNVPIIIGVKAQETKYIKPEPKIVLNETFLLKANEYK